MLHIQAKDLFDKIAGDAEYSTYAGGIDAVLGRASMDLLTYVEKVDIVSVQDGFLLYGVNAINERLVMGAVCRGPIGTDNYSYGEGCWYVGG